MYLMDGLNSDEYDFLSGTSGKGFGYTFLPLTYFQNQVL